MKTEFFSQSGFVTLVSTLIVGAVGLAITVSVIMLGLASSRTSFAGQQSTQARLLADACAEEGLQQIRDLTAYTGTGSLTIGSGACTYTVASQGGESRTVSASGVVGTVTRRVVVTLTAINPSLTVSSWQEVGNF
jgi:hypothetical protein